MKAKDEHNVTLAHLSSLLDTEKRACADVLARSAQLSIMAQALTMTIAEKDTLLKK